MRKRGAILAAVVFTLALALAATAEAACYKEGYLVHIGGTKNGAMTVFGLKTSLSSSSPRYDFSTDKIWMIPALSAAMYHTGSGKRVKIQGNATSCPTSGTTRFGGIINYFFVVYP